MGLLGLFVYLLVDVVDPCSYLGNQSRSHPDKLLGTGIAGVSKTLDCTVDADSNPALPM